MTAEERIKIRDKAEKLQSFVMKHRENAIKYIEKGKYAKACEYIICAASAQERSNLLYEILGEFTEE